MGNPIRRTICVMSNEEKPKWLFVRRFSVVNAIGLPEAGQAVPLHSLAPKQYHGHIVGEVTDANVTQEGIQVVHIVIPLSTAELETILVDYEKLSLGED